MYYVFSIFVLVMYSHEEPNAKILNKLKLLKHNVFFLINIFRLIATTHPVQQHTHHNKSVAEESRTLK